MQTRNGRPDCVMRTVIGRPQSQQGTLGPWGAALAFEGLGTAAAPAASSYVRTGVSICILPSPDRQPLPASARNQPKAGTAGMREANPCGASGHSPATAAPESAI
jgi:hypothetical protein